MKELTGVLLVQTVVPAYRLALYTRLADRGAAFAFGESSYDATVRTDPVAWSLPHTRTRNWLLFGGRLLWQRGLIGPGLSAELVVVEVNPRALSTWVLLALRCLRGRRTVGWGHSRGRRGATRPVRARQLMWRLCSVLLAYTPQEASRLAQWSGRPAIAAPNGLYSRDAIRSHIRESNTDCRRLLVSGRLVPAKRPDLVLRAFLTVDNPENIVLTFVGGGPMESYLRGLVPVRQQGTVQFMGQVHDPHRLAALYAETIVSLSPGYVGLSLIQSISHGVPMAYAEDMPHSPEIDAVIEGVNAFAVPGRLGADWEDVISHCIRGKLSASSDRRSVAAVALNSYNLDEMERGFMAVVARARQDVSPEAPPC